jgi:23S rRNA pseudouridine1911/1915/1917 synthase
MPKRPRDRKHKARANHTPSGDRRSGKARFSREVSVLYEDQAVIVLNKPPGLLAVPIKGASVPSALSIVSDALKNNREHALVVHRIDRFASGILLFAKTRQDRQVLVDEFLAHTPLRQYLAVVRGRLQNQGGTLVHFFRKDGMFQQQSTARDRDATRAELYYSVEREFADASVVRVELVTGLQNQIRAQFAAIGHPLIGDRKYSRAEAEEKLIDRVALHAARLEFEHPRTGRLITVDCPPPQDFERLLRALPQAKRHG